MMGWIAFRSATITEAFTFYQVMLTQAPLALSDVYADSISRLQILTLVVAYAVIGVFGFRVIGYWPRFAPTLQFRPALMPSLFILFLMSVLKLSAESYSPFLYFQF
jgi:alginate O-acetyltransferase complex protein AlgI